MARIRTVKPEFWTDSKTGTLTDTAKCLFLGLLNHADDYGVLKFDPAEWKARIFPYGIPTVALNTVICDEIFPKGLVVLFQIGNDEGGGTQYVFIQNFNKHQLVNNPSKPILPGWEKGDTPKTYSEKCGVQYDEIGDEILQPYGIPTVALPTGREGSGEEGKGITTTPHNPPEGGNPPTEPIQPKPPNPKKPPGVNYSPEFESFWLAYPRKTGKGQAWRAWGRIKTPKPTSEALLQSIEAHKRGRDWLRDDGDFIPHPATWINGRRWDDEVEDPNTQTNADRADRQRRIEELKADEEQERGAYRPG